MSALKPYACSKESLVSNYISPENSILAPTQAFTGQFDYAVQYRAIRVTAACDINATLYIDYSYDGINTHETITCAIVGGTAFFQSFPIENIYVRVRFAAASLPGSLNVYTILTKDDVGNVVQAGTGINVTGYPPTQTVKLADTAVTPGSYTNTSLTVDQQGRITAAASGSGPAFPHPPMIFSFIAVASHPASAAGCCSLTSGTILTYTYNANIIMPCAGVFSDFALNNYGASVGTKTVKLNVNGVDSALQWVIPAGTTQFFDNTNTLAVAKGDLVCYTYVASNTNSVTHSIKFTPTS